MEKKSSGQRPVEANSTGGQGSRRAVAPSDDDDDDNEYIIHRKTIFQVSVLHAKRRAPPQTFAGKFEVEFSEVNVLSSKLHGSLERAGGEKVPQLFMIFSSDYQLHMIQ
jgi:hypothetical protein